MDEVVARLPEFFPTSSRISDTEVAVDILCDGKFGFVHQVLAFIRKDKDSISADLAKYQIDPLTRRLLLEKYGTDCMDGPTFRARRAELRRRHYRVLGEGLLLGRPRSFWSLHLDSLRHAGIPWSRWGIVFGTLVVAFRGLFNLETVIRGAWGRWRGEA
jgi:hypothetical protein